MYREERIIWYWLMTGAILVFIMVAIGGITRLTHSGLSMVDWNLVMGAFPPTTESAWLEAFEGYKNSPEFKEINSDYTLSDFKSIYWWEYIHRVFGRLIGVVFLIPFIYFLAKKWLSPSMIKKLLIVFALGSIQAFLGWYMVKSGLVNVPRVSHYRLAAHLSTAFLTCMFIWWVAMGLRQRMYSPLPFTGLRKWAVLAFVLTFVQVVFGAFVAGLKSGWVHNTYPLMDGQLVSEAVFTMEPFYLNFFEGKSGVQFAHRMLAILVFSTILLTYVKAIRSPLLAFQAIGFRLMLILVIVQFLLGVFTLLYQVPLVLGILHQLGALLLLGAILYSIHSLRTSPGK